MPRVHKTVSTPVGLSNCSYYYCHCPKIGVQKIILGITGVVNPVAPDQNFY